MKDEDVRSHRSTYRTTIRRFADRALCAALARPADELPSPKTVLGGEPGLRHLWLLPTTTEPLPT